MADIATPALPVNIRVAEAPSAPATASVATSSAQIVAANALRKGLVIQNLSANTVSLGFGFAAVLNSGITLLPGGTYVMDEFLYCTTAVTAIASAAASTLSIQEYS